MNNINKVNLSDNVGIGEGKKNYGTRGVLEFIIKDRNGNVIQHIVEENIVKIFAKEMLSHRLPSSEVWNPETGVWETASNTYPIEEFAARYILLGASFDASGTPLGTNDARYYTTDTVTQQVIPIRLTPGASTDTSQGMEMINAIPISEPDRPLKKIERISFSNTYQPTSTPLVDESVRALNNIVTLETVIKTDEYNGFGGSAGNDFFTITEVVLAGGRKFDDVAQCGLIPEDLFLQCNTLLTSPSAATACGAFDEALAAIGNGTSVISLDSTETNVDLIKAGDQIKLVNRGGVQGTTNSAGAVVAGYSTLSQINPHYLVVSKLPGGRDIELDRVPVDSSGSAITGAIGVFRDTMKIFSQRILSTPVRKSSSFEITIRWNIIFN